MLKRAIIQHIQEHTLTQKPISTYFYKIFVVVNKQKLAELQQKIANFDKKAIIKYIQKEFESSRNSFTNKISRPT